MDRVVFRLRQLPTRVDKPETALMLSQALGIETSTIRIFSLARSVDPWIPSKTATLMFVDAHDEVQRILQEGAKPNITKQGNEWVIRVDDLRDDLVMDTHFRGLTPLDDPASHLADCIAISGLASHPFGSWQPKGQNKSWMWIRDMLPRSLPNVRPILYGYDTTLVKSHSFQTTFDLALGLIHQLQANGWTSPTCKPLVFLAHSLGGIVLKQALISLANGTERDDPILQAIKGAVFFGVPNFGMEQSHLRAIVEGQPNMQLVLDLSRESEYLQQLDKQFEGISYLRNVLLYWCYETKTSPIVIQDSNGKWSRAGPEGPKEILVTPDSATRGLYKQNIHRDSIFPINEDHSDMVKFSENDPNYSVVVQKLAQVVSPRESTPAKTNDIEISNATSSAAQVMANPQIASTEEESYKVILKSLHAPERDNRLEQIEEKFRDTFDWIYETQSAFNQWLQNKTRGPFWISGKPGSGKSTLMKFIFKDQRTLELLDDWKTHNKFIRVAFFFHHRGSALQKSFEGLLRSILSQIITSCPTVYKSIQSLFDKKALASDDWTLPKLQKAFYIILRQDDVPLHLCLFLDAIDEYDGRLEFICQFLRDLGNIPPTESKQIKLCFSSRPWDIFMREFSRSPGFRIQDFTQGDIADYCLGSLTEESLTSIAFEDLIPSIVTRARGVFLWVKLVIRDLAQKSRTTRTTKMDKSELEELLESFPTELDSYYTDIIERIPHAYRWTTYSMLEIAVRSRTPLTPKDFICAIECSRARAYQDGRNTLSKSYEPRAWSFESLVRRLSAMCCGGLIEVINSSTPYIQVLHQTVVDFVLHPTFKQQVLGDKAKITSENGSALLAKYAFLEPEYCTLRHGDNTWVYALIAENTSGRSIKTFLDSVPSDVLAKISQNAEVMTPLLYAVTFGLRLYIIESLVDNPNLLRNSRDPLLSSAVRSTVLLKNGYVQMAELLLEHGFTLDQDPTAFEKLIVELYESDTRSDDGNPRLRERDIWDWQGCVNEVGVPENVPIVPPPGDLGKRIVDLHTDMAVFLLDHIQDPNCQIHLETWFECKPLHVSPPRLARLLLDKGASVNALDSAKMTPLDLCFPNGVPGCINKSKRSAWQYTRWGTRQKYLYEIYELVCLFVARGGMTQITKKSLVKGRLNEFSKEGWPTEELEARLLASQKSLRRLLLSKAERFLIGPTLRSREAVDEL